MKDDGSWRRSAAAERAVQRGGEGGGYRSAVAAVASESNSNGGLWRSAAEGRAVQHGGEGAAALPAGLGTGVVGAVVESGELLI